MNRRACAQAIVFTFIFSLLFSPITQASVSTSPWQQLLTPAVQASTTIRNIDLSIFYNNLIFAEQAKEILVSEQQKTSYTQLIAKVVATTTTAIDLTSPSAILFAAQSAAILGTITVDELNQLTALVPIYSTIQSRFLTDYPNYTTYKDNAVQEKNLLLDKQKAENSITLNIASNYLTYLSANSQLALATESSLQAENQLAFAKTKLKLGLVSLRAKEDAELSLSSAQADLAIGNAEFTSAKLKLKNFLVIQASTELPALPKTELLSKLANSLNTASTLNSYLQLLYLNNIDLKKLSNLLAVEQEKQVYIENYFKNSGISVLSLPFYTLSTELSKQYTRQLQVLKQSLKSQAVSLYQNSQSTFYALQESTSNQKNQALDIAKMTKLYQLGRLSNFQLKNLQSQAKLTNFSNELNTYGYQTLILQLESLCGTLTYQELIK
ncbi:MAG: TolC family protein [Clostridia bacterium]